MTAVLCALVIALGGTLALAPHFAGLPQHYGDFVSGILAVAGHSKAYDFALFYCFAGIFTGAYLAFILPMKLGRRGCQDLFKLALIPAAWWFGSCLVEEKPLAWPLYASAVAVAVSYIISLSGFQEVICTIAKEDNRAKNYALWLAAAAFVIWMWVPPAAAPFVPTDDYHFGESLLPWQQFREYGKVPYVDFNLVHGFVHFTRGMLNDWIGDGTMNTFQQALQVQIAVSVLLFFVAYAGLLGTLPALLLCVTIPFVNIANKQLYGENYIILLMIAAMALLSRDTLLSRPVRWLAAYMLAGFALFMYRTTHGAALIAGGAPFALYMAWRLWREDRKALYKLAAWMAAVAAAAALLTPLDDIVIGMLRYVSDNAAVNDEAWGFAWAESEKFFNATRSGEAGIFSAPVAWEMLRLAWIPLMLVSAVICVRMVWRFDAGGQQAGAGAGKNIDSLSCFAGMLAIACLFLAPYLLGRLGTGGWSASGRLSILLLTSALPVLVLLSTAREKWPGALLTLAFSGAVFCSTFGGIGGVRDQGSGVSTKTSGVGVSELPKLGSAEISPERLEFLKNMDSALDALLEPDEGFYDMSSRNALYFYLDRAVPVPESSLLNTVGEKAEIAAIEGLKNNKVKVVFAGEPITRWGPVSVRHNLIYKFVAENFTPVEIGGLRFMVAKDKAEAAKKKLAASVSEGEAGVALLEKIFPLDDMGHIPGSWGASWDSLKWRAEEKTVLKAVCDGNEWKLESPAKISGKDAGILYIELAQSYEGKVSVSWEGIFDGFVKRHEIAFPARASVLAIPVDAHPGWLLAGAVRDLRVRTERGCEDGGIKKAALYSRIINN